VFRYRLSGPMGDDFGQVELSIPSIARGEQVRTGDGRLLQVLEVVDDLPEDAPIHAILMVEELESGGR
jgi:hypothetical protein